MQVGDAPILPADVPTVRGDGSTVATPVTWDAVDPADYAAPGTFTVEGRLDAPTDVRATATVTVTTDPVPVVSLAVAPETLDLVVGRSADLVATVTPANATARAVTWTTADPAVATVDADGTVTALAEGTTTVTATTADGAFTATVPVTATVDVGPEIPAEAWVDTFDDTVLDPRWTVRDPEPTSWSLTEDPGALTVRSLPGDTFQNDNTARNLFLVDVPAGDFTAYTELGATVTADFQGAGIIALGGDLDNYVRAGLTHVSFAPGGPVVIENAVERAAVFGSTFTARPGSTSEHLRVQRVGDEVTTSHWVDGAWVEIGTVTVAFDVTQVGLYALAAGAAPSHTVRFEQFALVEPAGADQVPEGGFTFAGDGDDRYLVTTDDGLALTDERPLVQTAFVATPVADPAEGTSPVTLADADSGLPLVVRGDRLALGAAGDEAAVVRLTDAGGGKVVPPGRGLRRGRRRGRRARPRGPVGGHPADRRAGRGRGAHDHRRHRGRRAPRSARPCTASSTRTSTTRPTAASTPSWSATGPSSSTPPTTRRSPG